MAPDAEMVFEYDKDVIGKEVEVGSAEITPERVALYLKATGETNPLYTDEAAAKAGPHGGLTVPPGILNTLSVAGGPNPNVKFGNFAMHSGTRLEVHGPIRVGDTINVTADVKEVYAKTGRTGTMVFAVRRNRYRNQAGELVGVIEQSTVHRDGGGGS
jgi:acyl dehydratase